MRSPSSLIFLVLLGIWAAYFVQYWVRRRDHLATARSVEQFSAAMRVLERRDALPRTDLSEPAPRSYAVHPARTARPQVLVKRAVAADPAPAVALSVSGRVGDDRPAAMSSSGPAGSGTATAVRTHTPTPTPTPTPVRRPGVGPRPRLRPSRRVRGIALLAAVAGLLTIVPLVVLSVLPVWALAPAIGAVGLALLWVRSGARAEHAMMRAHRRRLADLERRRTSAPVVTGRARAGAEHLRPQRHAEPAAAADHAPGAAPTAAGVADDALTATASVEHGAAADHPVAEAPAEAETEAVVPAAAAPDVMVPIVDEDDIPLTWDPVPVPRPTYTMKAKAERREVAPAAVTPDPAPMARPDDGDDTAYDRRRVAGA